MNYCDFIKRSSIRKNYAIFLDGASIQLEISACTVSNCTRSVLTGIAGNCYRELFSLLIEICIFKTFLVISNFYAEKPCVEGLHLRLSGACDSSIYYYEHLLINHNWLEKVSATYYASLSF